MNSGQQQPQTTINDDPKLGSIIEKGLSGQLSLIGFPHDIGAEREGVFTGQENGPDCLRRFLAKVGPLINPEYKINISELSISDYGNIFITDKPKQIYEELLEKLKTKVSSVLNKGNIPIVVGGSKDCYTSSCESLLKSQKNPQIISLIPSFDVRNLYDGKNVSISSGFRYFFENNQQEIQQKQLKLTYFGIQRQLINTQDYEYIDKIKNEINTIYLDEIRKHQAQIFQEITEPITQAGQKFKELLSTLNESQIHLACSLESINSACCQGVSRPSTVGGFTNEEMVEIFFEAGKCKNVISIDITDYNPNREDYRTGILVGNLIYFFAMGYKKRLEEK